MLLISVWSYVFRCCLIWQSACRAFIIFTTIYFTKDVVNDLKQVLSRYLRHYEMKHGTEIWMVNMQVKKKFSRSSKKSNSMGLTLRS